ncbi:cation-translocating P-type ATPase [Methanocella conradii]|uniref:cation-translocating P-type ATPase n=1 Tax=Methanocella conradii TaxID=1175444 RepID=UPI00157D8E7C|nr:cation-translocating P-type ATPase [Methanocella conradii]
MPIKTPSSRPRWRIFRILAFEERRAEALKEYLDGRDEVSLAKVNYKDHTLIASLLPGTEGRDVEEAATAGGFPLVESRAPLDSVEGRLEVALLGLTVPATIISFLGTYYGVLTGDAAMLLGAFIVFICGYPILKKAIRDALEMKFGSEMLLALAIMAPLPYSYQFTPSVYYASGIIVLIAQASSILNRCIEPRFKDMGFFLPTVALSENGEWVSLEGVKAGDVLRVKPGFRVPADGTVVEGEGLVARPGSCKGTRVKAGSMVDGGSLLLDGEVKVKAARDKGESRLKRAALAMEEARRPIEVLLSYPKSIERALLLVTIMGVSFVLIFFNNMMSAVAVLLAAAPIAALISRPLSLFACSLAASRNGAAFASHGSIERMSMADAVVFDGLGSVVDGASLAGIAAAEGHSDGDVKAAVEAYRGDDPTFGDAIGMDGGYSLLSLTEASRVTAIQDSLISKARAFESQGKLVRYAFKGDELLGVAAFDLSVPGDLKASVERLGRMGVKSVLLLSEEPQGVSEAMAKKAGISVVKPRMDDEERLEFIAKLAASKNVLAVGRGCGISRLAANAAAVTIKEPAVGFEGLEDAVCASPVNVAGLLSLSRREVKRASEGMSFGFYFNSIAIVVAAAMLVDVEIMLLMVVASVAVIATNSARLCLSRLK